MAQGEAGVMTVNGTHPLIAAHIARYRADEIVRDAVAARRAPRVPRIRRRGA